MIVGKNVTISPKASIYGDNLVIGDNVRIDDFVVLSCGGKGLKIGNHCHIACYTALYAGNGMEIGDFTGISAHCAFYSASDDYSGETMNNPTVPDEFKNVTKSKVIVGRHCLIGHAATIMPGVTIGDGVSVGAHSYVNKPLPAWGIYAGCPARFVKDRKRGVLELEKRLNDR